MRNKTYYILKNLNQPACVVLGLSEATSLSIVRSLGSKDIPLIGIDDDQCPLVAYSKYCSVAEIFNREEEALSLLVEMGKLSPQKNVLFSSQDRYLLFIDRHKNALLEYYFFPQSKHRSMEELINKKHMIGLAREAGLDIPLTIASNGDSLKQIASQIRYPAIIKPLFTQTFINTKGEIANSKEDLYVVVNKERFLDGYLIQEVVEGPEDEIWICGGYCNGNFEPLALFSGRKHRQLPMNFGAASVAISEQNEEVEKMAITFLKHIKYHGCFCFEVKRDKDQKYKFIEVNYRLGSYNQLLISSGIDLPFVAYCDAVGLPYAKDKKQQGSTLWISIIDDFITCLKYYTRVNKFILLDWIKKVLRADSYAIFKLSDIGPFLFRITFYIKKVFVKDFRRRHNRPPKNIIEIERMTQDRDFFRLKDQWNQLLVESGSDNIFLTWEWMYNWWITFKDKTDELFILLARDDSRLVGIAPFFKSQRFYKKILFLGSGIACSDYLSVIARRKDKARFLKSISEYLNINSNLYSAIYLESLISDKETMFFLKNYIDSKKWRWIKLKEYTCYYLPLSSLGGKIKQFMSHNRIKGLRKKKRRLSEIGRLEWKELVCSDGQELLFGFNAVVDLHQKRWKDLGCKIGGVFSNELLSKFLKAVVQEFWKNKWLSLNLLTLNEEVIAADCNFRFNDKIAYYAAGFDPKYKCYSPGAICLWESIQFYINKGYRELDFLRGEEVYKNEWTDSFRKTHNILIIKKDFKGDLLLLTKFFTKHTKRIIKRILPKRIVMVIRALKFNKSR